MADRGSDLSARHSEVNAVRPCPTVHGGPRSIRVHIACGDANLLVIRGSGTFCKPVAKATQVRILDLPPSWTFQPLTCTNGSGADRLSVRWCNARRVVRALSVSNIGVVFRCLQW